MGVGGEVGHIGIYLGINFNFLQRTACESKFTS